MQWALGPKSELLPHPPAICMSIKTKALREEQFVIVLILKDHGI